MSSRTATSTRTARRALGALLVAAANAGCGGGGGVPAPDGERDARAGDPGDAATPASLTVSPARSDVSYAYGASATATLQATAAYGGGATRDETARATWSVQPEAGAGVGASVRGGVFTATRPGAYTVTASLGGARATATVRVRVTGELVAPGTPAAAAAALGAAAPAGAPRPAIAYPLEGAVFPGNLGDVEIQLTRTDPGQAVARVAFEGDYISLAMVAPCREIAGATPGCAVTVDRALVPALVAASEGERMALRVRLARPDGGAVAESDAREVRWSGVDLTGALYYWSTRSGESNTAIYRYDFSRPGQAPEPYFTQARDTPVVENQRPCVGCHSISRDGRRMAVAFGGSDPGNFGLYDVATRRPVATRLGPRAEAGPQTFAAMSALSPDASRIVTIQAGVATLRRADETLAPVGPALFGTGLTPGDRVTEPYWSGDGQHLAFVGWNPESYDCNGAPCGARARDNGDLTPYGQVYVADVRGDAVSAPRLLVPRSSAGGGREHSSYYPAVSDDARWVVFNRVRCDAPGNGLGYPLDRTGAAANCSGYDNPGARVMAVPFAGGAPVDLARLNGEGTWTNSWPRFAPNSGTFRGRTLYWVAFSSKRPYGLRLPGDPTGRSAQVKPQLWFAAVTFDPAGGLAVDPSHAPIWLPQQNGDGAPAGNHVPQWVAVFVAGPG